MKTSIVTFVNYIWVSLIGFLAPLKVAFVLIVVLVLTDTVTGIMRAGRKDVERITSKRAFAIVPKMTFYFLLVVSAHTLWLVEPQLPFVKFALIGIGWIEVKSIDENFRGLFGFSFIDKTLQGIKQINQIKRHKDNA